MQAVKFLPIATLITLIGSMDARASDAPSAVLNKTIEISFNVNGTSITPDGVQHAYTTLIAQTIYVSTAGRMFFRQSATALRGRGSRQVEIGPEGKGNSTFRFEGSTLVGQMGWASGARQITASFNAAFTSCSAKVIEGKQGGSLIKRIGPNGTLNTIVSSSISNSSCSIKSGNAFSG